LELEAAPTAAMLFSTLPLLFALHLTSTLAQSVPTTRYTVWASVLFSRTGDRTPEILGSAPTTLTSLGAQQQYSNGAFFRQRYLTSSSNFSMTNGVGPAPMTGMSAEVPDVRKLYVQALDEQSSVASAQAFLQGLYPPVDFGGNMSEVQEMVDPSGRVAGGSYVSVKMTGSEYE
jgi:hypothetical protein